MVIHKKIAFGGGCHWCTEAVFQSLRGVTLVEQGFVASTGEHKTFSEAVIVHCDDKAISKEDLIAVHLHTHKSTAAHSMRKKYRSAIYTFTDADRTEAEQLLKKLQKDFKNQLITKVLPFQDFKPSDKMFHEYYYSNPEKPFCSSYIAPKLKLLLDTFSKNVDKAKLTV